MTMISVEITVMFKASQLITQADLDNFNGHGNGITLEEYIEFMIVDQNSLFDIIDNHRQAQLVSVKQIEKGDYNET